MKITKKLVFNVQCAYNPEHVFEKVFTVEDNTETVESEVQAFCPDCEKKVTVTIKGRVLPDAELLRTIEEFKLR
jgi:hypothetical protein